MFVELLKIGLSCAVAVPIVALILLICWAIGKAAGDE